MGGLTLELNKKSNITNHQLSRDEMITKHMNLVHSICQKYKRRAYMVGIEYDDLVGYATIGLIRAVDHFEYERELAFSTYASSTIKGAIRRSIRDYNEGPRIGRTVKEAISKITSQQGWQEWSVQEICDFWTLDEKIVKEALSYMAVGKTSSLNVLVDGGDRQVEVHEMIGNEQDSSEVVVNDFLNKLEPNVKTAVLLAMENKTQAEIANELKMSQPHVGRLIRRYAKKEWLAYAAQ